MISTDALRRALAELQRNAGLFDGAIAREHPDLVPTFRTAAIKSFEFAYELSIKLVRRSLEQIAASPQEIDGLDFKVMMRMAAEASLIGDPVVWVFFREKRNITSHTYDEAKALDVLAALPQFMTHCQRLIDRLSASTHAPV